MLKFLEASFIKLNIRILEYNKILMKAEDEMKTSHNIGVGTYYYKVISFGLMNMGATYLCC